jgi:mannose-6-phosphate isomerase-like protein (cupin superfamily)
VIATTSNSDIAEDRAYFRPTGEGELRWTGDTKTYFLAMGDQTAGTFCLVDELAKRGETVPLHRHPDDMESFYVVEGEITLFVDGKPGIKATPGAFAHIPGGTVHGFRVESETARYLILTTPHHGDFYRAISLPSRAGGLAPEKPIAGEAIKEACAKFGVEFIGPLPGDDD